MKTHAKKSSSTASKSASQAVHQTFFAKQGASGFIGSAQESTPALQMKMAVNKPGDKFEQEADKMADKVMRMPEREEIGRAHV